MDQSLRNGTANNHVSNHKLLVPHLPHLVLDLSPYFASEIKYINKLIIQSPLTSHKKKQFCLKKNLHKSKKTAKSPSKQFIYLIFFKLPSHCQ